MSLYPLKKRAAQSPANLATLNISRGSTFSRQRKRWNDRRIQYFFKRGTAGCSTTPDQYFQFCDSSSIKASTHSVSRTDCSSGIRSETMQAKQTCSVIDIVESIGSCLIKKKKAEGVLANVTPASSFSCQLQFYIKSAF